MAALSPGPYTRCGTVSLENGSVEITYETAGVSYTVFIPNIDNLRGNRDACPLPVFGKGPEGFIKAGYGSRSPSGRALLISTTTSGGFLSVEWAALQRVIHREAKQAPVSRLNATAI